MKKTILFLGLFGFFTQLFNGYFIAGVLVASSSLVLIFMLSFFIEIEYQLVKWAILFLAIISVLACIYDAYAYYSTPQVWGSYYGGWIWSIPVTICVTIFTVKMWSVSAE